MVVFNECADYDSMCVLYIKQHNEDKKLSQMIFYEYQ